MGKTAGRLRVKDAWKENDRSIKVLCMSLNHLETCKQLDWTDQRNTGVLRDGKILHHPSTIGVASKIRDGI